MEIKNAARSGILPSLIGYLAGEFQALLSVRLGGVGLCMTEHDLSTLQAVIRLNFGRIRMTDLERSPPMRFRPGFEFGSLLGCKL
jgi:hypothetical protein